MAAQQYEFYPPTNMNAIRYTIMQRIKQRNEHRQDTPLTPPTSKHDMDKMLPYHHLDNGLPSPPIESCSFEEEQTSDSLLSMHSSTTHILDSPPSPVLSLNAKSPTSIDGATNTTSTTPVVSATTDTAATTAATESPEEIREKIRLLKEEKHKLFQAMKDLLSQPKTNATTPTSPPPTPSSPAPTTTTTTTTTTSSPVKPVSSTPHPLERSRSQSRDGSLKARPIVIRSRSISHSEFSRPISRYNANTNGGYHHERSRFYNSSDSRYPYNNRLSLSSTSSTSSSQIASHAMPRRIVNNLTNNNNNNNNINSYPSSRHPLAIRPSPSSRQLTRSDRHSRY